VAQVGQSAVISADGFGNSINFDWQTIGTKPWNCEQVVGTPEFCK